MNDKIKQAIKSKYITSDNISFDVIKSIAGRDCDVWDELGRGRSILNSQEQLDQYLYSYGPMIKSQWSNLLESISIPLGNATIIDYACGQGLASLFFLDKFKSTHLQQLSQIVLIEPSQIALERAQAILDCYCPHSEIKSTNKKLDDLTQADLELREKDNKIHLFSNILDVSGFDQFGLFNKIFATKGFHYIIAVSHDRSFDGGSQRLRDIYNAINDEKHKDWLFVQNANINQFTCSNGKPAISFYVQLEVL